MDDSDPQAALAEVEDHSGLSPIAMKIIAAQAEFSVEVEGSHCNIYTVRCTSVSGWTCTCPAFEFGRGKECKHIKLVKDDIKGSDNAISK